MDPSWDPLLRAVFLGRLRLTRLLLEGGAYINESDPRGLTPLMVSLRSRHQDPQSSSRHRMVRYLLDRGADPNIQDSGGRSALVHAVMEGVEPVTLSLLLGRGADPSLPDRRGSSALVHAVRTGDRATLRLLVDACRARGQEVIIISSDQLHTSQQLLSVSHVDQQREHCSVCCVAQYRSPPQGASASTSPQPGSPLLGTQGTTDDVSSSLLQLTVSRSGGAEEELAPTPRPGKLSLFSRRHSVDDRDTSSLLSTLRWDRPQGALLSEQAHGWRALARKMSYDGATASRSNQLQETPPLTSNDGGVSGLETVIRRRSVGVAHYSSDSQLASVRVHDLNVRTGERRRLEAEAWPQESVEQRFVEQSSVEQRSVEQRSVEQRSAFDRRGSGALLLDHIATTRPGFLPPLNPHAPIPDIGVCATYPCGGGGRRSSLTLCRPPPCAPEFLRDTDVKRTLWRRHSMQSEQIQQLADFKETMRR